MVLNKTKHIISGAVLLAISINAHAFDSLNSFFGLNFGNAYASVNKPLNSLKEGDFYQLSDSQVIEKSPYFSNYFIYVTPTSGLINGITAIQGYKTSQDCVSNLPNVLSELEQKYGKSVKNETPNHYTIPDKDEPTRTLSLSCNENAMLISVQDYTLTKQAVKEYLARHPEEAKKD